MKLRNKKTGEIENLSKIYDKYNKFEELIEEWEYYEEPKSTIKDVWFNSTIANGHFVEVDLISDEEAEKAVEKLKAWKRLRDRGFRFSHYVMYFEDKCGKVNFKWNTDEEPYSEFEKDLLIIFGGK